ncbi:hypothetical protein Pla8534_57330 [Lignipirellula cremea]|uniref:Uncharacterized protein n=1 Tax=Lignipirellula cremea TaxID=2528010 RepID=A0A518E1A3_9BACT|nr:hypothetical protein Pla8534_57330 [Lignipirellula cremea]
MLPPAILRAPAIPPAVRRRTDPTAARRPMVGRRTVRHRITAHHRIMVRLRMVRLRMVRLRMVRLRMVRLRMVRRHGQTKRELGACLGIILRIGKWRSWKSRMRS